MGKNISFLQPTKMKGFQLKKNSLSYLKCVLRISCVVHRPIYGRFLGFLCTRFSLYMQIANSFEKKLIKCLRLRLRLRATELTFEPH